MVERYQGEQLPPVHPDPYGRPPLPDGREVPRPGAPDAPPVTFSERLLAAVLVALVLAVVAVGVLRR